MEEARPDADAEAWIDAQHAALMASGHPVSKRYLRQRLIAEWAREERAAEAPVLTFIRHGGDVTRSVPVDGPVGEMVAARLARRQR